MTQTNFKSVITRAQQTLQQKMVSANYTIEIGFQQKKYNRKLLRKTFNL